MARYNSKVVEITYKFHGTGRMQRIPWPDSAILTYAKLLGRGGMNPRATFKIYFKPAEGGKIRLVYTATHHVNCDTHISQPFNEPGSFYFSFSGGGERSAEFYGSLIL